MLKSLEINLCLESCNLNLNENQHWHNRICYKRTFSLIKATLSAIGKWRQQSGCGSHVFTHILPRLLLLSKKLRYGRKQHTKSVWSVIKCIQLRHILNVLFLRACLALVFRPPYRAVSSQYDTHSQSPSLCVRSWPTFFFFAQKIIKLTKDD